MDPVRDVAQIIYYITLSIAGPLALFEFLKARKADRRANEYKIYDELNDRFFEYQKIALEYYDLDILDVPNNDPSLAFDKKRKQEMVAHAMLFSLLERAFLMFYQQEDQFRLRQWSGWKHYLNDFIRREAVRSAWRTSRATYDTDFQIFMDAKIAEIQKVESPQSPPLLPKTATPALPNLATAQQIVAPAPPTSPLSSSPRGPELPTNRAIPITADEIRSPK
jgi:hypothetical protein